MPNAWLKLSDIIGAWIGLAIGLFLASILFIAPLSFEWMMWNWSSPATHLTDHGNCEAGKQRT
ncbi:hypothetical protein D3C76_1458550 [compost metagenome]